MELGVGNTPETGLVFDDAELSSPPTVPARIRRRLTETKASGSPSSIEEIESKLRNADLRRQKFYENLSSKARPKRRIPQSGDDHNLAGHLEAKLQAAEQKRMQILKAHSQQRATLRDRTSQSLLRRCWRKFLKQRTTIDLAKSFHLLNINTSHKNSMTFEHFAFLIEKSSTLHTTKSLLDRLETRYQVLFPNFHGQDDINHLLTRVVSKTTKPSVKLSRYQPRIVLSSYMILDYPDAIFSRQGDRETALTNSAKKFVQEFELLVEIIMNGPSQKSGQDLNPEIVKVKLCTFRSQLLAFDAAWCSYLNSFVVWKVKDVESLELDLVKAACQMEMSMMKKYKVIPQEDDSALTDDVKALQKQMQVTEHQKLLREQMLHLSGEAGIKRMENAVSDTRKKYFQSKENNSPIQSPIQDLGMENVLIVNEFLHGQHYGYTNGSNISDENRKVRNTMEKAFWDGINDSIQQDKYDHVVVLMKEVRDELCEMSPQSHKQEIHQVIDLDILSKLLSSSSMDMEYLGTIMEFSLVNLQKLSAIAHENQLKESHQKVLLELAELCQAGDGSNRSRAIALIKGLRFVLEQIQVLKQEICKARIKMLEPLLKGPTGVEYLSKAFEKLYGSPSDALNRLPLTKSWLSSVVPCKDEEWNEHKSVLSELQDERTVLPSTALRTGGSFSSRSQTSSTTMSPTDNQYTECKGEKCDVFVRLGLVKLVNNINGLIKDELPETLKLNFLRLRGVQTRLQKITVIATGILVLRQTLVMDGMISSPEDMESTILKCSTQLSETLDTVINAGLEELVEVLSKTAESLDKSADVAKSESRRVVMARMLRKSVQAGDPVFVRVSHAVYLATRVVVFLGGGNGREAAEKVLRQVGAAGLAEKVVEAGEALGVMSRVSGNVLGPWYARLIESM